VAGDQLAKLRRLEIVDAIQQDSGQSVTGVQDMARELAKSHQVGSRSESSSDAGKSSTACAVSWRTVSRSRLQFLFGP